MKQSILRHPAPRISPTLGTLISLKVDLNTRGTKCVQAESLYAEGLTSELSEVLFDQLRAVLIQTPLGRAWTVGGS